MASIKLRYFKPEEFEKATPACSIDDMDEAFLLKLDDARSICFVPFVINSAFRSKDYEKSKNRSGTSSHCKGLAVDIRCNSSADRLRILLALLAVGFRRIGLYSTFIHIDMDTSKRPSVWLG